MPLGCLCVMDTKPRAISHAQIESLRALSRQVVAQFELRRMQIMQRDQAESVIRIREEAKVAERAKATFLANISHEFRTPMNGVVGVTSLLLDTPLSERQRHYVETVAKSAEGLIGVLSNILDYTRNEIGRPEISMTRIDLPKLIEDMATIMRAATTSKQVRLTTKVDSGLTGALMADELKLQQILSNLIGNAIKFTPEGSVDIHVKKLIEGKDGMVIRFEVQDTGIGIPKNKWNVIFNEFEQVEQGTERTYGGAGMGLGICRQLAAMLETKIEMVSEVGVGSIFWFDLTLPYEHAYNQVIETQKNTSTPEVHGHPRILVAEDNEVNCLVISTMLEHNGCKVTCVNNGEEAVQLLTKERFDLVFMDVNMPKMDGLQTTRAIRHLPFPACNTPVVALTASAIREDETQCRSAGMNDFISKPISEKAVKQALSRWLARTEGSLI